LTTADFSIHKQIQNLKNDAASADK
jgi:hypothetical protein